MSKNRQLAAIVFTDIADFTKLSSVDEDAAFDLIEKPNFIQLVALLTVGHSCQLVVRYQCHAMCSSGNDCKRCEPVR